MKGLMKYSWITHLILDLIYWAKYFTSDNLMLHHMKSFGMQQLHNFIMRNKAV